MITNSLEQCTGVYQFTHLSFSGGSANNIHLLVDAPREINIARSSAGKKKDTTELGAGRYYKESGISDEAQKEIVSILMREKRKNAARHTQEEA